MNFWKFEIWNFWIFVFCRATHLHAIPRGLPTTGLPAVLLTLHRPKDPLQSCNSSCIVRTHGLSTSVCQKRLPNSRSIFGRFLERSLGLLCALKNYEESGDIPNERSEFPCKQCRLGPKLVGGFFLLSSFLTLVPTNRHRGLLPSLY